MLFKQGQVRSWQIQSQKFIKCYLNKDKLQVDKFNHKSKYYLSKDKSEIDKVKHLRF